MANNVNLPGAGVIIASLDNGSGVEFQEMAVVDKTLSQVNPATSEDISNKDIMFALKALIQAIANPAYIDKTANQLRAQITGSVNSTATMAANQDIRNVTGSLAVLTNIDIYQGRLLMVGQSTTAWALSVRNLLT